MNFNLIFFILKFKIINDIFQLYFVGTYPKNKSIALWFLCVPLNFQFKFIKI